MSTKGTPWSPRPSRTAPTRARCCAASAGPASTAPGSSPSTTPTRGSRARWWAPETGAAFPRSIEVPFPPESPASGVGERGFHPVVWYRRRVPHHELVDGGAGGADGRVLVRFGAVDHSARVWLDGRLVADHVGGQTPFTRGRHRGARPGRRRARPRGPRRGPARRRGRSPAASRTGGRGRTASGTSGPPASGRRCGSRPCRRATSPTWPGPPTSPAPSCDAEVTLARRPAAGGPARPRADAAARRRGPGRAVLPVAAPVDDVDVPVPALRNGQDRDRLLWSPEQPALVDVEVVLRDGDVRGAVDARRQLPRAAERRRAARALPAQRPAATTRARCSTRATGRRPTSPPAAPRSCAREVELIKAMGFNAVRVHQKAEDPRFLYWADRLGLLVWGETAGAYAFWPEAVALLTREWIDLVRRDRSHPSWSPGCRSTRAGACRTSPRPAPSSSSPRPSSSLTRALDPSRPGGLERGLGARRQRHPRRARLHRRPGGRCTRRYRDAAAATSVVLAGRGPAGPPARR